MQFLPSLFYFLTLVDCILACGFHGSSAPTPYPAKRDARKLPIYKKTVLKSVRVLDGYHLRGLETVVIDGSRIGTDVTDAVEVIDGHGRVLIPGLIDSHTHVYVDRHLEDHSSYGVTTVFNMNCFNYTLCQQFKSSVGLSSVFTAWHPAVGPEGYHRITSPIPESELISSPSQATEFVSWTVGNNSDFLKVVSEYGDPSLESQKALVQAAHDQGISSATHASFYEPFQQAIDSKSDIIQHISADALVSDEWTRKIIKQGQAVVPTMAVFRYASENPAVVQWLEGKNTTNESYAIVQANVKAFHRKGVTILAGTDSIGYSPQGFDIPHGLSLHRELANLVEVGFTPLEALRSATSLPAKVHHLCDRGVIAPGKRADLILLNSDPFLDITNTRDIARVWIGGLEYEDVARP